MEKDRKLVLVVGYHDCSYGPSQKFCNMVLTQLA
jgi:hypothetical protein